MKDVKKENSRKPLFSVTIKDCEIQTFRSGGKGGQNQNKVESGVRIIHHPSGARGESREDRSQLQNKRNAFRRMGESRQFKSWVTNMAMKLRGGKTLDDRVEEQMAIQNLVIETQVEGKWKRIKE
jgi:protein subunit release factor B